jgi:hypothetical protein
MSTGGGARPHVTRDQAGGAPTLHVLQESIGHRQTSDE